MACTAFPSDPIHEVPASVGYVAVLTLLLRGVPYKYRLARDTSPVNLNARKAALSKGFHAQARESNRQALTFVPLC
jgi:hypothetical protein